MPCLTRRRVSGLSAHAGPLLSLPNMFCALSHTFMQRRPFLAHSLFNSHRLVLFLIYCFHSLIIPLPSNLTFTFLHHFKIQITMSNSTDLLTADSTLLSEHKPVPSVQSKVHDLARRYSAMAKQSTATDSDLGLPHNNRSRGGSFGRTEVSKVADLLGRHKDTTAAVTTGTRSRASSGVGSSNGQEMSQENTSESKNESEAVAMEEEKKGVHVNENADVDIEKEVETSLRMADLTGKVEEIDLVDIPLNNHISSNDTESNRDSYSSEEVEEAVQETNHFDLEEDSSLALGSQV